MFLNYCIANGTLDKHDKSTIDYQIMHGLDLKLSQKCNISWSEYNLKALQHIEDNIPDNKRFEVLRSLQPEDYHWDWFQKSLHYSQDGYEWFYLIAEDDVQGMCLAYQPKDSIINDGQIYYIEYLAVAPWNRKTLIYERKYSKVATTLLLKITEFLYKTKGLTQAFSLHSLPQAIGFYEHIGMINCPIEDKDGMKFYEMPAHRAQQLMRGA